MSITGSSSIRRLKDCPVVMDLHELSPVDRRATGGRDGRWLERLSRMSPPQVGHSSGNPSPSRTVIVGGTMI
jgi:hypothetical protein